MLKKYFIPLAFFLGILLGIISNELVVPVSTSPEKPYYHGIRGRNQIALTINVDWGEEYLPGMLKIMEERGVKATFFVTGQWAMKNKDLLKTMAEKGHEIGNHIYSHQHPFNFQRWAYRLIKKNEEVIADNKERTRLLPLPMVRLMRGLPVLPAVLAIKL